MRAAPAGCPRRRSRRRARSARLRWAGERLDRARGQRRRRRASGWCAAGRAGCRRAWLVVERAVEQLVDAGEALHRERLHRGDGWTRARYSMPRCARSAPPHPAARLRRSLPVAAARAVGRTGRPPHSARFPTQSLGDRGADVRALQYLLPRRGTPPASTAVFTPRPRLAGVAPSRPRHGLAADGDRRRPDLGTLSIAAGVGQQRSRRASAPDASCGAKRRCRGRRRRHLRLGDGRPRCARSRRTSGLPVDGRRRRRRPGATCRPLPVAPMATSGLCDYSVGNGPANWGTASAIATSTGRAGATSPPGHGRVALGDVGLEHGGNIAGHDTHEVGLDVDLRLMRKDRRPMPGGTQLPARDATTGRRRARSSRRSARSRPAT